MSSEDIYFFILFSGLFVLLAFFLVVLWKELKLRKRDVKLTEYATANQEKAISDAQDSILLQKQAISDAQDSILLQRQAVQIEEAAGETLKSLLKEQEKTNQLLREMLNRMPNG